MDVNFRQGPPLSPIPETRTLLGNFKESGVFKGLLGLQLPPKLVKKKVIKKAYQNVMRNAKIEFIESTIRFRFRQVFINKALFRSDHKITISTIIKFSLYTDSLYPP